MDQFFDSRQESLRFIGQDRRRIELHRAHHLYGNGARCASPKVYRSKRFLTGGHDPSSIFALDIDDATSTVGADFDAGAGTRRFSFAATFNQRAPADRSGFNAEGTRTGESRCPKGKGVGSNGPGQPRQCASRATTNQGRATANKGCSRTSDQTSGPGTSGRTSCAGSAGKGREQVR